MTSDLGLNPASSGHTIRVPLPPLTEERRNELIKILKDETEKARISIRSIRRDANTEVKRLLKDKAIGQDDERQAETKIQELTNQYMKQADDILAEKEKSLSTV
jgi:ribosome recycling factor